MTQSSQPEAQGEPALFADSLLSMLGRISKALGISEEEQACANADAEILDAIADMKARAGAGRVTLPERISQLVEQHGSLRAAARVLEVEPGYLSRLARGEKVSPGATLLRRMGLRRVVSYELMKDHK